MRYFEEPICFTCNKSVLVGVLNRPEVSSAIGVVIIVGGPQYRVGSHRQFVSLARYLAQQGISVFRFDYRGMGDSDGPKVNFEQTQEDIKAAVDCFYNVDKSLSKIVLWGLCDGASAASLYSATDPRVIGLTLLNPWVRTESGRAQTMLKNYYLKRLLSKGFWINMFTGKFALKGSLLEFSNTIATSLKRSQKASESTDIKKVIITKTELKMLPDRMLEELQNFTGKIQFILSQDDLVAKEFLNLIEYSKKWKKFWVSENIQVTEILGADHTFSSDDWKKQVEEATSSFVATL